MKLPTELSDRLLKPLSRFLRIEASAAFLLLLATVVALVVSNSSWAPSYHQFWEIQGGLQLGSLNYMRSLRDWVNDAAMTLFFFLVALELKREISLGEMSRPHRAMLSIAAAVGGMAVPAMLYWGLQNGLPGAHGWGTVMATDTAFVIGCLALLSKRIPRSLRVFMLSLAIVDDIGAILIVAIGYSEQVSMGMLALAALGIAVVRAMSWAGFRGFPLYFLVGGLTWIAVDVSGIHPTITGVILGLMTPARRWVSDRRLYAILSQVIAHPAGEGSGDTRDRHTLLAAEIAARETLSPVERLELGLHPWVGFVIMPLFALANAGFSLQLEALDTSLALAVFVGFAVGKPVGILAFSWLSLRVGIATRPPTLTWGLMSGGAMLAGIGFTMALFIAGLALPVDLLDSAKLGIFMASGFSVLAGLGLLFHASRAPVGRR
ncbi:Na+/H+ antiporter NhaA [Ectopseudomonas mendocina]|uniref:Na+/H+ antiporter NhaA n=1 Tax=Ectopseudomonas mendocina TaxID=300 RepID=UPI000206E240|nr:Na+/H+ antiporter NhaA [Pseudomonas mendocina]AEB58841.1 Na+/H+ antiporter NhaA [Pseudomonas mendocina NK-01]